MQDFYWLKTIFPGPGESVWPISFEGIRDKDSPKVVISMHDLSFFSFGKCLKKKTNYFWSSSCLTQTKPELHWNDAVRVRYIRPVLHQPWQTDISFFPPVYSSYPQHLSWPSAQLSCPFLLLKISTKILSISSRKLPYCTFISRSRKFHWSQLFTNP